MNNIKQNQFRAFWAITWSSFRAQTRNKATFFFGFLFPIVFISIFGLIGNSSQSVRLGIAKTPNNSLANSFYKNPAVSVVNGSDSNLAIQLKQGKLDAILSFVQVSTNPPVYNANLTLPTNNPQSAALSQLIINAVVDQENLNLAKVSNPPIHLSIVKTSSRQSRYIDFALPGMIGFSLLGTAIFGTVFGLIFLKKELVIKRMFATPMKPLTFLLGQGASRLIMAVAQTILILIIGVFVFKFYLPEGFLTFIELMVLSVFGLVAFLGFGYFMAGLANDENSANPMVNLVTLPQFLLGG